MGRGERAAEYYCCILDFIVRLRALLRWEGWTVAAQSARGSLNYGHVNKYLSSIVSSYLERFPATDAEKSALGQAPAAHLLRRGVHR